MAELSKDALQADLKEALKAGDRRRVSTIRLLIAAVKNREIELGKPVDAAELVGLVNSGIKKRRESIEGYEKGGRQDLVQQETEEMAILQAYLPPPLDEGAISALIDEAIRETGASGARDMGAVMKWLMPRVTGRADGRLLNQLVKARLS